MYISELYISEDGKYPDGYLEFLFGPRWTYISIVRKFLQKFLLVTLDSGKWADLISISASELLENAIKYASEEGTKVKIVYYKEKNFLKLYVENFSKEENIDILKKEIERTMSGPTDKMYLEKMMEAGSRDDGESRLGFARIRYETNAKIELKIDENKVRVILNFDLNYKV